MTIWPKEICKVGWLATLRTAKKAHECAFCWKTGRMIEPGERYLSVFCLGSGASGMVHPDRAHLDCIKGYFDAAEAKERGLVLNSVNNQRQTQGGR